MEHLIVLDALLEVRSAPILINADTYDEAVEKAYNADGLVWYSKDSTRKIGEESVKELSDAREADDWDEGWEEEDTTPQSSGQPSALEAAARAALADLMGLMPVADPNGEHTHPGWKTIRALAAALNEPLGPDWH